MKYLGNYQSFNLPKNERPKLFAYADEREIIVSYNDKQPFYVEQIAILIDSEFLTYAVFECGIMFETDEGAKQFGKDYTCALIELVKNYQG